MHHQHSFPVYCLFSDWINDDLLTQIEKNDTLLHGMTDPRFMRAVTEFQTNPEMAMEKYRDNVDVQNFLKQFCGLMGECCFMHLHYKNFSKNF